MPVPEPSCPSHVPPELVVDFDYFGDPSIASDPRAHVLRLRGGPGLVYTLRNGGHWVATRAALMTEILSDPQTFGSFPLLIPKSVSGPEPRPFAEIDPPQHAQYRLLLAPLANPRLIQGFEDKARALMDELIDSVIADGECEFDAAIAQKFPIYIIMGLLDLPPEDRPMLMKWTDQVINHPDSDMRTEARRLTDVYVEQVIAVRRGGQGSDIISSLANGTIDGRPVSDREAMAMVSNLVHGGLDTVRANMNFFAQFLATHDEHRRQLAAEPDLIPSAVDELLRWLSLPSIARTVRRTLDFHGLTLLEGDQVLMPFVLAGADEAAHDNALVVDFRRPRTKSLAFGAGPHFCPGQLLARTELRIFLQAWLSRIPEFRLSGREASVGSGGIVAGLRNLWLAWPAGAAADV